MTMYELEHRSSSWKIAYGSRTLLLPPNQKNVSHKQKVPTETYLLMQPLVSFSALRHAQSKPSCQCAPYESNWTVSQALRDKNNNILSNCPMQFKRCRNKPSPRASRHRPIYVHIRGVGVSEAHEFTTALLKLSSSAQTLKPCPRAMTALRAKSIALH